MKTYRLAAIAFILVAPLLTSCVAGGIQRCYGLKLPLVIVGPCLTSEN